MTGHTGLSTLFVMLVSAGTGALVTLGTGCDGDRSVAADARADHGVTDARVDALPAGCPAHLPGAAAICSKDGLTCEYGDNPSCPATAVCSKAAWQVSIKKCPGSNATCPNTLKEATSLPCQSKDATCNYAGLYCTCTNCTKYPLPQCSGPLTWHCQAPNPDPACPHAQPAVGAACSKEGQFCNYGCELDESRACKGGKWAAASAPGGCPRSSRRVKEQIRYLTDADRERIAAQASGLRLATYRYRAPAPDRRAHLGFILEDHPACLAASTDRGQVDLYSYTSMVLALAQQQQRALAALRREVAALRARIARTGSRAR